MTSTMPEKKTVLDSPATLVPLVHAGAGWRRTLPDLAGPGRRWIVSPWVNSGKTDLTDLLELIEPGDRLIIRGRPEDFIQKMSSVSAIQRYGNEKPLSRHFRESVHIDGHQTVNRSHYRQAIFSTSACRSRWVARV